MHIGWVLCVCGKEIGGRSYMEHHTLDPYPVPKEKAPLYVNEPLLIDKCELCKKEISFRRFLTTCGSKVDLTVWNFFCKFRSSMIMMRLDRGFCYWAVVYLIAKISWYVKNAQKIWAYQTVDKVVPGLTVKHHFVYSLKRVRKHSFFVYKLWKVIRQINAKNGIGEPELEN